MTLKKTPVKAFVVISENTKSVLIHFDGFEDFNDAKEFSDFMVEQLGIEKIDLPINRTLH
tara:strand:- start:187 stop:366 length:180 start_codon:yes stop_codon:yes gene_type:complete